jgi:ribokinase
LKDPIILVVGSLHYDIMVEAAHLPRRDETAIGSRWYPKFGGKGGNQAMAAQKAGGVARMCGAVGTDDFGRFLRENLRAGGVDDRFVVDVSGSGSGMSVAIMDAAGDYAATIVSGANLLISHDVLQDAALWDGVAILVLQNEVQEAVSLAAATQARARGIPTLLNAAPYRPLAPDFSALVDILVVNAVEAEMMGANPVSCLHSAADAARNLATRFSTVIVTAGAQGLAAWTDADGGLSIPAQKVKVISTHGAGDAFIGTLATHLARGEGFAPACHAASAAAARHVGGLATDDAKFPQSHASGTV